MYGFSLRKFGIFFLSAAALVCVSARAKDPQFPPTPKGFKIAMEIELLPEKLANLMELFDFENLDTQLQGLGPEATGKLIAYADTFFELSHPKEGGITKNYLRNNPKALDSLSAELKSELTQGLNLQKRVLRERTQLLGSDGKPLVKAESVLKMAPSAQLDRPRIILPSESATAQPPKLVGHSEFDMSLMQKSGSIEVPNRLDWEKLYERWENLPEQRRRNAMKTDLMSLKEKAFIFRGVADLPYVVLKTDELSLPLRIDISEKDRDVFSRLEWESDQDAMEFRHKGTVDSPEKFLDDLQHFAGRADIKREIFDPEKARLLQYVKDEEGTLHHVKKQWGSFHYHYSMPQSIKAVAEAMNVNLLVRRLELGINSDFERNDYGFDAIGRKGLVRLHDTKHMEMRSHHELLRDELKRQLEPLFLKGPAEAANEIAKDTSARLTDQMVRKIALSEHRAVLKQVDFPFEKLIQELEADLAQPTASRDSLFALNIIKPKSKAIGRYFELILGKPEAIEEHFIEPITILFSDWLKGPRKQTQKAEAMVAALLRSGQPKAMSFAMRMLRKNSWPIPLSDEVKNELSKFLQLVQQKKIGSEWHEEIILLGKKLYKEDSGFLPTIKQVLLDTHSSAVRRQAGIFLTENFPGDKELFHSIGGAMLGLEPGASKLEIQVAAVRRLGDRIETWEATTLREVLESQGKLLPEAEQAFAEWYGKNQAKNASQIKLAYKLGEFHPELRAAALADLMETMGRGNLFPLDVILELNIRDSAILQEVKKFGDKGNTGLANTVRKILAGPGVEPKACSVEYASVIRKTR